MDRTPQSNFEKDFECLDKTTALVSVDEIPQCNIKTTFERVVETQESNLVPALFESVDQTPAANIAEFRAAF